MDYQGAIEKFEELSRHHDAEEFRQTSEQRRHVEQYLGEACSWEYTPENPSEAGDECVEAILAMEHKYESLWRVVCGDKLEIRPTVVLEKDKHIGSLGAGLLTATLSPGTFGPDGPDCGFTATVHFDAAGGESFGMGYSERETVWFNYLCDKIQHDGGQGYHPYTKWKSWWTDEKAERAQVYLEEKLPRFEATFQWLLEAACEPELNPEIANRARIYREELFVAT